MDITNVEMTRIYGGLLLFVMVLIIILLFINDFIRKRMISACNSAIKNRERIPEISVDSRTADYLERNCDHELHRIDEYISKKDDIVKYKLYLKKRRFAFYLRKQNLWNYKVLAIKMY